MCRMLALSADRPVDPLPYLTAFAERCRLSKEYQGHGWGVAWREEGAWRRFRTVEPIWETVPPELPASSLVLIHARSAFRNERIAVENNMPFVDEDVAFAFNGELRGVRLQVPGDTGAWRLYHLYRRFLVSAGGDGQAALRRLDALLRARTRYVRALNLMATDGGRIHVSCRYSEDPEYFTLWTTTSATQQGRVTLASSETFDPPGAESATWAPLANGTGMTLQELAPCSS